MPTLSGSLVLASASPRRREILTALAIPFDVQPSAAEERRALDETPLAYVQRLAADKAASVAAAQAAGDHHIFVLGADTIVLLDDTVLEKPADDADARRMIGSLAGRWHAVWTALAVFRIAGTERSLSGACAVETRVRFRQLDGHEIDAYVASGEGQDKAGAYAVQGLGGGLVSEIAGCYHNVVGLPAAATIALLREVGLLIEWP